MTTSFSVLLNTPTVDHGSSVTVSASGLAASASGWESFYLPYTQGAPNSSGGACSVQVVSGAAECSILVDSNYDTGTHYIQAYYYGDGVNLAASSTSVPLTVNLGTTTLSISQPASGASVTYGTAFTAQATIQPPPASGSAVVFSAKSAAGETVSLGSGSTNSAGLATLTLPAKTLTSIGTYTLYANYAGDSKYKSSTASTSFTVVSANMTMTLAVSSGSGTPLPYGTNVTLIATVSDVSATGKIVFYDSDGVTILGSSTLNNGVASFSTTSLKAGSHSITAKYIGTGAYNVGSVTAVTVTITTVTSSMTLTSSAASPVTSGKSVTLTATMQSTSVTGSVTFYDNDTQMGSAVALTGGKATYSLSAISVGVHKFKAVYDGDGSYQSAVSTLSLTSKATTAITISFSSSSITFGKPVTLKASVTATSPVLLTPPLSLTGGVTFYDNGQKFNSSNLGSDGTITFVKSDFTIGIHEISANYDGNDYYFSSSVDP